MQISEINKCRVLIGKPGISTVFGECEHNIQSGGFNQMKGVCHFDVGSFEIDDSAGAPILKHKLGEEDKDYSLEQSDGSFKIFVEVEVDPDDSLLDYK